jgi:hypothetical protein
LIDWLVLLLLITHGQGGQLVRVGQIEYFDGVMIGVGNVERLLAASDGQAARLTQLLLLLATSDGQAARLTQLLTLLLATTTTDAHSLVLWSRYLNNVKYTSVKYEVS